MQLGMSEKIDKIIETNAEIKQSYKTLVSLIKGFFAGCGLVFVLVIAFMIDTRSDIAEIKATLATTENIATLREEIRKVDEKLHNEIGRYISLVSYIAIETNRSITVADLLVYLGRLVNVKEEELEVLRSTSISKLNNSVNLGTTRGN